LIAATHSTAERAVLSTWVPRDIETQMKLLAQENERSVSGEVRLAVREHLERMRQNKIAAEH
jgi:hypothetical protein